MNRATIGDSIPAPAPLAALRLPAAAFAIALAGSAVIYAASGPTLGLFIGAMVLAAVLVPTLSLSGDGLLDRALVAAAVCDGIATVWIVPLFNSPITLLQLLLCYLILVTWCAALLGMMLLFSKLASDPIPAAAVVVLLGLLWLACPIWLPAATGARIDGLLAAHPLFAVNRVLIDLGLWTQQPLAYRYLFSLGQDVPYTLPRSILPSAGIHLLIGLAGIGLWSIRGRT